MAEFTALTRRMGVRFFVAALLRMTGMLVPQNNVNAGPSE
jgi:hypothetical protein